MRVAAILALLLIATPVAAQPAPRAAILAAMADSAAGWNQGKIDRFLAIYSDDPATSFTGSKGVERGKRGIRMRYLTTYKNQFGPDSAGRSTLSFETQDFRLLGKDHALLIARWKLVTTGKPAPDTGMTSLVFRHEKGGWHIVADHSS
jgi:uncharacterized protein (TIGR02246 family)